MFSFLSSFLENEAFFDHFEFEPQLSPAVSKNYVAQNLHNRHFFEKDSSEVSEENKIGIS